MFQRGDYNLLSLCHAHRDREFLLKWRTNAKVMQEQKATRLEQERRENQFREVTLLIALFVGMGEAIFSINVCHQLILI